MKRAWLGIALLAASWMFGVGYLVGPNWWAWGIITALGLALLIGVPVPLPASSGTRLAGAAMLLPVVLFAQAPYRWPPVVLAIGLVLWESRALRPIASALIAGGVILIIQALALTGYGLATARSHELPEPLPQAITAIARWLGIDAGTDGWNVTLGSMRQAHPLGATWELLLDPPTVCFIVGGLVFLALSISASFPPGGQRVRRWFSESGVLLLCVLGWLPLRVALLMSLYIHRAMRTDYDATLSVMNQFWSPWVRLALVIPPALLAAKFVRLRFARPQAEDDTALPPQRLRFAAVACSFAAIALLTLAFAWDPVGERKGGRVLVDEFHSNWERTDHPFDTEWYDHLSAYNYAVLYDYCSRFFEMGRLTTAIDDQALRNCDVLICKIPTERYQPPEVAAIRRFVERGGGLMLVGEHTDVWGSGTDLNDIAREFGFEYRMDCLFGLDSTFEEHIDPPAIRHPVIAHMGPLDFAVSCSIAPGVSLGTPVMWNTGLRNAPADYHASNFYPQVLDFPQARYGAFVKLWATTLGRGRVLGFTDSTIWSNFCFFDPGKSELFMGMTEWLNRSQPPVTPWPWLTMFGLIAAGSSLWLARQWNGAWLVLLAAATLGWGIASAGARVANAIAMPLPETKRPYTHVIIDQTISEVILPKAGFIAGQTNGFGIFERWILRLGYFFHRRSGPEAFTGSDLSILIYPSKSASPQYVDALERYVTGGGKVLIVESPDNKQSTVEPILERFGLKLGGEVDGGDLLIGPGWPTIKVGPAREIVGGTPFIMLNGKTVAATANKGKGTITVIGFGSRFNDYNMGFTGDNEPDPELRAVYGLDFELVSSIIEGRPMNVPKRPAPATAPTTMPTTTATTLPASPAR